MKLHEAIAGILAGTLLWACLDLSPVEYHPPDAGSDSGTDVDSDAGDDDGGAADAAIGASPECRTCIETGACGDSFAACGAEPKCVNFVKCMSDTGCWPAIIVDVAIIPPCIMDCAAMSMVVSQVDPALTLFIPVLICAQTEAQCGSYCTAE